ncbi:MAG: ATP-binding cassette domain-containing protein, partial [Cyanobacteria bacterium J06632_3]
MTLENPQPARIVLSPDATAASTSTDNGATDTGAIASAAVKKADAAGVSLRSVTKKYSNVTAIENITLDIPAGAYCCLLGPSGCGKTTALRMVSGHEAVTAGEIYIAEKSVTSLPPAK